MLFGQLWWGFTILTAFVVLTARASRSLTLTEIFFASIPVGTIGGAWITFLVSCLLNEISAMGMVLSTLILVHLLWTHLGDFSARMKDLLPNLQSEIRKDWLMWVNMGIWGYFVVPLFSSRFFPEDDEGHVYSGGSCWADLPIHLHMAHSFLYGRNRDVSFFDMHSPVFAGAKMAYPFLPDWHAAMLNYLGDSMRWSMMMPGIAMFFSLLALLFAISRRMVKSSLASCVSIALIILAGGTGGINLSRNYTFEQIMIEFDPIQDDVNDKGNVFWFAFLPHVYLPQRGATFAYPLVLTCLLLVWCATSPTKHGSGRAYITTSDRRSFLMMAAIFAASLPLVQAHSYIGLAVAIGMMFLLDTPKWLAHPVHLLGWIPAGIAAVALAAPQLMNFMHTVTEGGPNGKGTFMEIRPIWSPPPYSYPATFANFWWFWWRATGPALPLITTGLIWWGVPAFGAVRDTIKIILDSTSVEGITEETPGATSPVVEHTKGDLKVVAHEDGTGDIKRRKVYSYGGVMKDMPTMDDAEDLQEWLAAASETYSPIASFARIWERAVEQNNSGRVLDAFKFGLCGAAVWMFGNYVMLQPWDRDNCKLLYIGLFMAMPLAAKILCFPFEHIWSFHTGHYYAVTAGANKRNESVSTKKRSQVCAPDNVMKIEAGVPCVGPLKHKSFAVIVAAIAAFIVPIVLYYACYSGALSVTREYRLYHVLYDRDARAVGEFMREHVPPKSVMLHHDTHLTPAGYYAGRPTLVAYSGWMWSHGYDYHDRHRDRNIILDYMLKDSDPNVYNLLRRWGVRYVLGENPRTWPRDTEAEDFDEDLYLDKNFKRIAQFGRYHVFEVLGYGFPPS